MEAARQIVKVALFFSSLTFSSCLSTLTLAVERTFGKKYAPLAGVDDAQRNQHNSYDARFPGWRGVASAPTRRKETTLPF